MKRVPIIVTIVTLYAIVYQLTPQLDVSGNATIIMFVLAPIPVLWMAYNILKHSKPSQLTFDEQFYEDWNYKRNGKEEM
jgi:hypothetical protein